MKKQLIAATCVVALLASCASSPEKMAAADVSPLKYQQYDCEQVAMETDRISRKVNVLYHQLDKDARNDAWQMGVGLVLLWPVLFALEGGDGPEAVEYRQLKGEYNALQQVAIQKKCGFDVPDIEKTLPQPENEEAAKDKWGGDL
jgi:hypothetical protein